MSTNIEPKLSSFVRERFKESDKYADVISKWIAKAWGITQDTKLTEKDIRAIDDCHYERCEDDMFNWIHDNKEESPSEIKRAQWVDEIWNILILPDGSCYFWYEIENY